MITAVFAADALLPDGPARDVRIEIDAGRISTVTTDTEPGDALRLPGVLLPGFADVHSHAFHRALRGRTHDDGGTFWTWRRLMYAVAARLDPDLMLRLARAVYAEAALAGVSAVGEFHYLHHAPGGVRYADPNAMAEALRQAAADAGVRLTLLDTAYLAGGLDPSGHRPLDPVQQRFSDGDVGTWAARVAALPDSAGLRVGVAIHSVRAVPAGDLSAVGSFARSGLGRGADDPRPLHVHLSEQPAENAAALGFYGRTPTALLERAGVLGPGTTAVHATHLTEADVATLGAHRTGVCFCPTTERDLADGIGPARLLADAGCMLSLGSDQHAVLDLVEEARALELGERVRSGRRGCFSPAELLAALTRHQAIGWPDAGRIAVGARADLVAVRTDTVRTAGARPEQIVFAATAADVDTVIVDGEPVVRDGRHRLGDVGALLAEVIAACQDVAEGGPR
ncbi:formiminoglutamate deiminase [Friedmanniella endophytica]|uniref:Formiminoglutamate deiminase n=1 Tax=Microlunatus kandeliicorticis TaxID=1759536 RepID=A0A7W3IRI3_9ACTN|nr:formimidoylglutamate deiminase [Microlunatus kandeliicorticis]MBA8793939.1 formiminoglutamate deiminase [Microlunatus kandeliicorticis]